MTRNDNPEYFAHICLVVEGVFAAEHRLIKKERLTERLKAGEITPQQYIEEVAEEMISQTPKSEFDKCVTN